MTNHRVKIIVLLELDLFQAPNYYSVKHAIREEVYYPRLFPNLTTRQSIAAKQHIIIY